MNQTSNILQRTLGTVRDFFNSRKEPSSLSFEEAVCKIYGGSLCKRCRAIVYLGVSDPPTPNLTGKPTGWRGNYSVFTATGIDQDEMDTPDEPHLSPNCVLCQRICKLLPQNTAIGHAQVSLARLTDHIILGPKSRADPSLPYTRLDIKVQQIRTEDSPLLDIELGLLPYQPIQTPVVRQSAKMKQIPFMRHILPEQIDYDLLRDWIRHCKLHHDNCRFTETIPIPGFRVIDCLTKKIVVVPSYNSTYVALSYVWGQQTASDSDFSCIPHTIEDSITVTLALGYQYLWVDRYCIDQADLTNKHIQIGLMNYVYSQAEITLVAIADDTSHGLPGVGSRPRHPQEYFQLGPMQLVSFISLNDIVVNSPWAQRGWTFQEGCLSNRKLIFTDHGVIFMCYGMQCWENIEQDFQPEVDGYSSGVISRADQIIPNIKNRGHEEWTNIILEEYSRRTLSFDEDALQACLGILRGFNVTHYWGVKITNAIDLSMQEQIRPLAMDLYWRNYKPTNRREGFPTWSWTSCGGKKDFGSSAPFAGDMCDIAIQVNREQEHWVDVAEFARNHSGDLGSIIPGKRLRITGRMLRPIWVKKNEETFISVPVSSETEPEVQLTIYLDTTDASIQPEDNVQALVIETNFNDSTPILMLLENCGDSYRRIGLAQSLEPRELSLFALRNATRQALWMEQAELQTIFLE